MSFIFLEQSLYTRFPGAVNRCKVVFSSPKHSLMSPREVPATVKNCFTIRVRVPHCPSEFHFAYPRNSTIYILIKNGPAMRT